jgi:predicted dithiol-disulfide oxidoreductase (DUF899 family)
MTNPAQDSRNLPPVVSREEWLAARKALLVREKELTRSADRVNADRRRLPMVRIDKEYRFEGPDGEVGLIDLYDVHSTLDDRVAPPMLNFRDETELAAAGMPWSERMRGDWPGISAFLRVGDEVFHTYSTFGRGIDRAGSSGFYLDLTALGRQEDWEEPKGRAEALGMQAGGPGLKFHDRYSPAELGVSG